MLQELKRKSIKTSPPLFLLLIFCAGITIGYIGQEAPTPPLQLNHAQVCFSPNGNCEKQIVQTIQSAEHQILVQCYSFTSKPIADALIASKENGIRIAVLYDKSQLKEKHTQIRRLEQAGIPTYIDEVPGIAHNKIIIIDSHKLVTGSYNFSNAANVRNAENVLFINNNALAQRYTDNWNMRVDMAKSKIQNR